MSKKCPNICKNELNLFVLQILSKILFPFDNIPCSKFDNFEFSKDLLLENFVVANFDVEFQKYTAHQFTKLI